MQALLCCSLFLCLALTLPGADRIQVHGHRGARALRPENTIPAFQYAIEAGVDVLELDLNVTKDGIVVVSHDAILRPPVCTGPEPQAAIHQSTFAELRQWDCGAVRNPLFERQTPVPGTRLPTLGDVFALGKDTGVRFNIETKIDPRQPEMSPPPEEFVKAVLAVIRKHRMEKRVILQSFDFRTLHEMKRQAPEIELSALYSGPAKSFVDIASEAGATIVSPEHRLVTSEQVASAHAAGLQVVPWTANAPADWERLKSAHVDAIISDDPAALIAWLKQN